MVWLGMVWLGIVWLGMVWLGIVWLDMVWLGMAVKNYPKLTLFNALESAHWFLSYGKVVFHGQLVYSFFTIVLGLKKYPFRENFMEMKE